MRNMEKLRESVLSSFEEGDLERADKYIDSVRDSLKSTNSRFGAYTLLLILSLVSYHLYVHGQINELSAFGLRIKDVDFIRRWFLIVPSVLFVLAASIGYLRVYQQECIEWLLFKYRPKEYSSGIYRLTFPSNHILGLDVLRRQNSIAANLLATLTGVLLAAASITAPVWYIFWAYTKTFADLGTDTSLVISFSASSVLLVFGVGIISQSQRI
jgi:hypothetical protein